MSHLSHHCGRLDPHDEHIWSCPTGRGTSRSTYTCHGAPLIEGGWFGSDAHDDAAEERAEMDRREREAS